MSKNDKCPLVWEWDEGGEWHAYSQIMDPVMLDEPVVEWWREYCLQWVIYVDESGLFHISDSDKLLFKEAQSIHSENHRNLDVLKAKIDLVEDYLRTMEHPLSDGSTVVLLPKEKYVR
jgi:hypothetical protein